MLAKLLSSTAAKFLLGLWKTFTRDRMNRKLGAATQRESDNEADKEQRQKWVDIDQLELGIDDALSDFGLSGDGIGGDFDEPSPAAVSDALAKRIISRQEDERSGRKPVGYRLGEAVQKTESGEV